MQIRFLNLFLLYFFLSAWLSAAEPETESIKQQHLFRIERSKNANIVQYDARVRPDGTLDPETPVVAYWIRLAEDGQKMDLRKLEKRFAYGFETVFDPASNSATLEMKVDIGRELKVLQTEDGYRATSLIDGRNAVIKKIFVQSSPRRFFDKVEYIELHGVDPVTGECRFEKYIP